MSLRSEAKEAVLKALRATPNRGCASAASAIERNEYGGWTAQVALEAVLAVIDEYEEVTLCENRYSPGLWYSEGTASFDAKFTKNLHTFLRRKQKPEPDVTELARRAVKVWRGSYGSTRPVCDAMDALEKKLDE